MQNINYRLLAVLATVSWIGLCVFSAATWSHQFQAFRTNLATRSVSHLANGGLDEQPEAGYDWSTCIWSVALIVNVCIYLAFHFIKRALVSIRWKLEQLSGNASGLSARASTETTQSLQHIDQHLHGVRQSQASLLALIKNIQATSAATSHQPELTVMQQSNIDRSLFYLQHIAEYFRVRTGEASAIDGPAAVAAPGRRHTLRSPRSELILKRISRQLIQPIRMRYNAMYMRRERLDQLSANKTNRAQRSQKVRRTQSCSNGGGQQKHPAAGDNQLLVSDSKRKEAHGPQSRLLGISYRRSSERRAQTAIHE